MPFVEQIGSSVGDIDVSRDGDRLVVTTYAGFLSVIELDTGEADPFVIGAGPPDRVQDAG
jgi:hypothetical protein